MRILLVSSGSGSRGGGEIFLDYLGKGLADKGHDVMMWMPSHPRMDELAAKCSRFAQIFRADYRGTYDYPSRSLATCFNWGVSGRIAREWEALRPDVVHINKQNLEDGLDLLRAARQSALPSISTIHLTQSARYLRAKAGWLRDFIARWHLRRYNGAFVAVQEQRRAALDQFLGSAARSTTVLNGVPLIGGPAPHGLREAMRKELGVKGSDYLILGLGRLVEQKRPFLFLRVAEELHRRMPTAKFVWVGDGNLEFEWRAAIAARGLGKSIWCSGWVNDVLPYLVAGDLLVHVAEYEGLPFAIIEAMAAGLACAVNRDFASEISLFNESNVLFVDDIADLARKLHEPRLLADIGQSGRQLVETKLSVSGMTEAYEKLYLCEIARVARANS